MIGIILLFILCALIIGVPIALILLMIYYFINKDLKPFKYPALSFLFVVVFTMCVAVDCSNRGVKEHNRERSESLAKGYHIYSGSQLDHYRKETHVNETVYDFSKFGIVIPVIIYAIVNVRRKSEKRKS
ncbi:MAG: hypothetical protein KBT34_05595 [Prevotella sp.]|nr:hypothetical protein [Candidatus Prevotella equi]